MIPSLRSLLLLMSWGITNSIVTAAVTLPPIISDHAVLQRSAKTAVWGTADPNEHVAVTLDSASGQTTAGADGKWRIELDLSHVAAGPFDLIVQGTNKITVSDVVVGEVWVASGQSNMEFPVKYAKDSGKEIAASANPLIRSFHVEDKAVPTPLEDCQGSWVVAGPPTTGNFTAVGYFFCMKLQEELSAPVGLINSTWGGTPVEAWTSLEALNSDPALKDGTDRSKQDYEGFAARSQAYAQAVEAWETQYNRTLPDPADPAAYAGPDVQTSDWKMVHLPTAHLSTVGLPDAGAIWIRRTVTLPRDVVAGHPALILGLIPGFDAVYWNGVKLAETRPETGGTNVGRKYLPTIPLQEGVGVLAIRLAFPIGGAAMPGPLKWGSLTLDGDWLAKVEKELPAVAPEAKVTFPRAMQKRPEAHLIATYLFNGMIAPLTPYTIKGVVWYQGENNAVRAMQYATALPLMIQDWRTHWNEGNFPFYFCQLANYNPLLPTPGDSNIAELRDSQKKTLSVPNTGMAVLIDCGEEAKIHPIDKQTPGGRLAAIALANTYERQIPFTGPAYASMTIEGSSIRVSFTHTDGGLTAKVLPAEFTPPSEPVGKLFPQPRNVPNSQLEGFAICGSDHVWKWAGAKIDNGTVVVQATGVTEPIAVRYGWADNPICNLYNGAGFPAVPFRTDDFPEITRAVKF